MKFGLFIATLLFAYQALAQDSTIVRFHVKGGLTYQIRMDGVLMPVTNKLKVSRGTHAIEIFSPKYKLYNGKLETGKLDSTNFVAVLELEPGYLAYVAQRESYKNKLFWNRTAPFVLGLPATIAAPLSYRWRLNKHEALIKEEFYHGFGVSNVVNARNTYTMSNVLFFTSSLVALAADAVCVSRIKYVRELQPPVYRQVNPFTQETIEIRE